MNAIAPINADASSAAARFASVPLSLLDHDEKVNVRHGLRAASPAFVANIRAKGILQPLIVRDAGGRYSVTDGGKRLAALLELKEEGAIDDNYLVPIEIREEDDATARETSLATNIVREQMHPVDEFEAFAQLVCDGATIEDIATHYAKTRREVEQSLALGGLASEIRAAWRKGILDREAAEAFTLFTEPREQLRVFDDLRRDGHVSEADVRKAVKGADRKLALLAEFVGVEAFGARGGEVTRDLFGTNHVVAKGHEKLLAEMKREILQAECDRLKADGWAWAETKETLGRAASLLIQVQPAKNATTASEKERLKQLDAVHDDMNASHEAIEAAEFERADIEDAAYLRGFSEKQKARLGCVVDIDFERNRIAVDCGKQLPPVKKADAEATPVEIAKAAVAEQQKKQSAQAQRQDKAKTDPKEIDGALMNQLQEQLQRAAAKTLKVDPGFGLDVAVAAMAVDSWGCVAEIEVQGQMSDIGEKPEKLKDFGEALARVQKMSSEQKLKWLARFAAMSLNFMNCGEAGAAIVDKEEDVAAIVDGLDPKLFNEALRAEFDAKAYFDQAPKPVLVRAIAEAVSGDEAHKAAGLSDVNHIRKFCNQHIPKTGWLPIELRTPGYAGPGAGKKAAAKPAPKKTAKKKAKRK